MQALLEAEEKLAAEALMGSAPVHETTTDFKQSDKQSENREQIMPSREDRGCDSVQSPASVEGNAALMEGGHGDRGAEQRGERMGEAHGAIPLRPAHETCEISEVLEEEMASESETARDTIAMKTDENQAGARTQSKKVESDAGKRSQPSSFFSFFGRKRVEEPAEEAVEETEEPEISSELCALVVKDIESLLADPARKSSSLVKILKEAHEKVREVDKKRQDASGEAKLLSCAVVLKAGVQAAELKHKTLSAKGLALLQRLACYHAMQPVYFPAVTKALRTCAESGDELLQVKVLQVCAAAAESEALACSIGPALSIVETILVVMGSPAVGASRAAEATLHQAVKAVLRFVSLRRAKLLQRSAATADKERASLEVSAAVAAQVLQEIVVLCTAKMSERLKYRRAERAAVVALQIVQDVLRERAGEINELERLRSWLVYRLCPMLLKQLHQIAGGAMRLLPRESPASYSQRVAVAVHCLNAVAALVSNFPYEARIDEAPNDSDMLVSAVANVLSVVAAGAQVL